MFGFKEEDIKDIISMASIRVPRARGEKLLLLHNDAGMKPVWKYSPVVAREDHTYHRPPEESAMESAGTVYYPPSP